MNPLAFATFLYLHRVTDQEGISLPCWLPMEKICGIFVVPGQGTVEEQMVGSQAELHMDNGDTVLVTEHPAQVIQLMQQAVDKMCQFIRGRTETRPEMVFNPEERRN